MEEEFYCPKTYTMCSKHIKLVDILYGQTRTVVPTPICHLDSEKCKFTIHKKMLKALEKCSDASETDC